MLAATGMQFVAETLSSEHPQTAIRKIQARASLAGLCQPLCGLVDHLGISRADAHRAVLAAAKAALLARVAAMGQGLLQCSKATAPGGRDAKEDERLQLKAKLERLLHVSFHYLGIQELRDVPLAVMNTLDQVGKHWIGGDGDMFLLLRGRPKMGRRGACRISFHCLVILPFFSPQVPPLFLKQLTADKQIFKELPAT